MSSTLIQFRTDDASKIKASSICERLGIDLPPYYDGSRMLDMIAPGGGAYGMCGSSGEDKLR